jgi:hypothetical protein
MDQLYTLPTSGTAGPHYLYPVGTIDSQPGDRLKIQIAETSPEARKILVWDTRNGQNRVQEVYKITNNMDIPLAPGPVRVYRENVYIGSDPVEWTPAGGEGSVTLAGITGIRVQRRITEQYVTANNYYNTGSYEVFLRLENYSGSAADLIILEQKNPYGNRFRYSENPEEQPGNVLRWEMQLDDDEKREITYRFDVE